MRTKESSTPEVDAYDALDAQLVEVGEKLKRLRAEIEAWHSQLLDGLRE